jgi:hypothetical protein
MLEKGVKVSAGTDATRVASYNPWVSLSWMVTGKTVGGMQLYPRANCLDRETALRMWTENVTWFSNEEGKKGRIEKGQFADLVVPDKDFFSCAEDEISFLSSDLTMVGGKIVYGAGDFKKSTKTTCRRPCRTGRLCAPSAAMRPGAIRRVPANVRFAAPRSRPAAAPTIATSMATTMPAPGRRSCRSPISRASSGRSAAPAGRLTL